jgi:hypothetical protein
VPWSPTVEETRAFAVGQCRHDWVLLLDDDECLSIEAVRFIAEEMRAPRAEAYRLPRLNFILGRYDPRAWYGGDVALRLLRRDRVEFTPRVHDGMVIRTDQVFDVPLETGAHLLHFSHADSATWIEKTNRYTSQDERLRFRPAEAGLLHAAREALDRYAAASDLRTPDPYVEAVAVLRAVYDMVDEVKHWEAGLGETGAERFQAAMQALELSYAKWLPPARDGAEAARVAPDIPA